MFLSTLVQHTLCPNRSLQRDGVQALSQGVQPTPGLLRWPKSYSYARRVLSSLSPAPQVRHSHNFLKERNHPDSLLALQAADKTISARQAQLHTKASIKENPKGKGRSVTKALRQHLVKGAPRVWHSFVQQACDQGNQESRMQSGQGERVSK